MKDKETALFPLMFDCGDKSRANQMRADWGTRSAILTSFVKTYVPKICYASVRLTSSLTARPAVLLLFSSWSFSNHIFQINGG